MAQIGTNEPSINDLVTLFGGAGYAGSEAVRRNVEGARSTDINQQQVLQDLLFKAQEQPENLRQKILANKQTEVQIPGQQAQSDLLAHDALVKNKVGPDSYAAAIRTEQEKKAQEAKWDTRKNIAYEHLMSTDPAKRAIGQKMVQNMPENIAEELKQSSMQVRTLAQIKETGVQLRLTQAEAIKGGKYAPKNTAAAELFKNNPAAYWRNKAYNAENDAEFKTLSEMADREDIKAKELATIRAAQAAAGKIDIGKEGGVATIPPPTIPTDKGAVRKPGSVGPGASGPVGGPTVASQVTRQAKDKQGNTVTFILSPDGKSWIKQ